MSKKDQLHEWIESGNEEEKARVLSRIKGELAKETPSTVARKKLSFKKIASIAAAAVVTLGVGIFSAVYFTRQGGTPAPKDENRYCASSEYSEIATDLTLKEYALQTEQDILYFDWYENAAELRNKTFEINDTKEVICFKEEMFNTNTGAYIKLYVTDNKTDLEELAFFNNCINENAVSNIKVNYIYTRAEGRVKFEYNGYRYYLRVDMPQSEQAMFALVEELLSA